MTNRPAWQFTTAEEAIIWSADVLRARRQPRLTILWKYVLSEAMVPSTDVAPTPAELADTLQEPNPTQHTHLPSDPDDRYTLALAVEKLLTTMGEEGELLRLYAWGDWASEVRLRAALKVQEMARREGKRLRLNYRMSYRQLASMLGLNRKVVTSRICAALRQLATRLQYENMLFVPENELPVATSSRVVSLHDFSR